MRSYIFSFFFLLVFFLGSTQGLQFLDIFSHRLIRLAHAASTHKNMQSHFRIFTQFCSDLRVRPLPVQPATILRYISFLSATGRSYGTVQNHISTIKHYHRLFGFPPGWENLYSFQLALRGCKRFLGAAPARKLAITPILLSRMVSLFDATQPLQAAMRALFLVAFFSFLRKSNLVVPSARVNSPKVPRRSDFHMSQHGAFLNIHATKTIQFFQRALCVPLPSIPGSPLCPVAALQHHLRLNAVRPSDPLFSVLSSADHITRPLTFRHFSSFLARVVAALGLDPRAYSPHSFRRGGATFAFECNVHAEHIKFQGYWSSDAYLVYLEMSPAQKRRAVNSMVAKINQLSSA